MSKHCFYRVDSPMLLIYNRITGVRFGKMEKYVIIIIIKSLISFLNLLDYTNNCVRLSIWRKGWENEWHEFIHPITFLLSYRSKINYSHLTFAQFYFKKRMCVCTKENYNESSMIFYYFKDIFIAIIIVTFIYGATKQK